VDLRADEDPGVEILTGARGKPPGDPDLGMRLQEAGYMTGEVIGVNGGRDT